VIRAVDHIGIAVESIETARRFWEALGLKICDIEELPQEGVRVAILELGGARIELLEPTRPDSPVAKFLAKRGPGIHHLCLASDALEDDDARLAAAGVERLRAAPTSGAGGARVQFVHPKSAGGVLVEISQRAEPEAAARHGSEAPEVSS
jgi:methylmalonyl-CoA/ethylmalonyl-CoA epimerase